MQTSNFEAIKVALKQDKTGYILTLCIHPDEISEEIMRDFVGARYQVVMVRVNDENMPMNRDQEFGRDSVRIAGMLCRDQSFWRFLKEAGQIFEASEDATTDWLKHELGVTSRADIPKSQIAVNRLISIRQEFNLWKQVND